MRIEIDTAKDTHEDIRKAIKLLMSLVGAGNIYSNEPSSGVKNIFDDSSSMGGSEAPPSNPFAAMFGGDAPAPSAQSMKKPDDEPQIELY